MRSNGGEGEASADAEDGGAYDDEGIPAVAVVVRGGGLESNRSDFIRLFSLAVVVGVGLVLSDSEDDSAGGDG